MRHLFREIFGGEDKKKDSASDTARPSSFQTQSQNVASTREAPTTSVADPVPSQPIQLPDVARMSGREFEYYMAKVFETLGYEVNLVGGTGDQGVDLLIQQGHELIAVQCNNYNQPVVNKPVQD